MSPGLGRDKTMNSILDVMKRYPPRYVAYSLYERPRGTAIARLSTMLFRIKCFMYACSCGKGVVVYGKVVFLPLYANIDIGDYVLMVSSSWRCSSGALNHPVRLRAFSRDSRIALEDTCSLNGTSITCRSTSVHIGAETMIAPNVTIVDSDFHAS
jgi:hypothetical protein